MPEVTTISVHVQYFAMLREERGLGEETVETAAATAADLYQELKALHGFGLPMDNLQVAINEEIHPWPTQLNPGDRVVFIPPVAGG